jgi:hypothetical protein
VFEFFTTMCPVTAKEAAPCPCMKDTHQNSMGLEAAVS